MARAGNDIHIPIVEDEALRLLMNVNPTAEIPRPAANPNGKPKPRQTK